MKVCNECNYVYRDSLRSCPICGGEDFEELLVPFYNDAEGYLEENEDGGNSSTNKS